MRILYRQDLKEKARNLRNNATRAERVFWSMVRGKQLGYDFHRQKPIGNFIYDFHCFKLNLVIEIDGATHLDKSVRENDRLKDEFAESIDLRIVRFTDDEVLGNADLDLDRLKRIIEEIEQTMSRSEEEETF